MPASSEFFEWSYYLNFYVTVNLIDFNETKKSIIFTSVYHYYVPLTYQF